MMGWGNKPPAGVFDQTTCTTLTGWAQDPDAPEAAVTVELFFDGEKGDPAATGVQVVADVARDDLSMSLGSCNHGFELDAPLGLRDGAIHPVHAYALDTEAGTQAELQLSPGQFQCEPPPMPAGVRRWVTNPESLAAWKFSPFWQMIKASDEALQALPLDRDLEATPLLVSSDAEPGTVWLVDDAFRRRVPSPEVAAAWGFDLAMATVWPAAEVQALIEGSPLRPAPILTQGTGPEVWLIDDHQCDPDGQNACVLHYIVNDQPCRDGDLLLLDVAAEYGNYNSDLNRTIPVNGKFTPRQRAVYDAVHRILRLCIDELIVPGKHPKDVYHKEVARATEDELIALGLLDPQLVAEECAQEDLPEEKRAYRKYFMHGVSHSPFEIPHLVVGGNDYRHRV